MELLGSWVCLHSILRRYWRRVYHSACNLCSCSGRKLSCSTSSPPLDNGWFFNVWQSGEYIMIPHCGFILHSPYFQWGWAPFHVLISHFNFRFCYMLIQVPCTNLYWVRCHFHISRSSEYILALEIWLSIINIISYSVVSLFTLFKASFDG